jgi:uncharacterized protein (TIGR03435 family)
MKKLALLMVVLGAMSGMSLRAQDVAGQWQGTLHAGSNDLRIILKIAKDDGKLAVTMYSIDQGGQPFKATGVGMDGSTLRLRIDVIGGKFEGKLSGDGKTIAGTWTQGPSPLPLVLVKSTKETAWEIPAPPAPPKLMAADADPGFDVATIKPNDSGGTSLKQLTVNGRNFSIRNGSLADLIGFAYDVQKSQIANGPEWMTQDRYDLDGVPDKEGAPSPAQLRVMMQKLLADRFALKFHPEKREMQAFVLAVGKGGQKIATTQINGPLPSFNMGPGTGGLALRIINAKMEEFTSFMQMMILDKPVVDQTGLAGRYDFNVTFAPDDSQFNGHPPRFGQTEDGGQNAPNLFEAMQEQAGLKLSAEKTPVKVVVVDHVEKPSAN